MRKLNIKFRCRAEFQASDRLMMLDGFCRPTPSLLHEILFPKDTASLVKRASKIFNYRFSGIKLAVGCLNLPANF